MSLKDILTAVGGDLSEVTDNLKSTYYEAIIKICGGSIDDLPDRLESTYLKRIAECVTNGSNILDTSDATATAEDIAEGKTAYVNGVKITGTAVISKELIRRTLTAVCPASAAYMGDTTVTTIEMLDDGNEYQSANPVSVGEYVGAGACNRGKAYVCVTYDKDTQSYKYRYLMAEVTSDAGVDPSALWVVGNYYNGLCDITLG